MDQRKQYESLFPEYSFVNLVGQGSYGDVFFCIRKSDKKKVAIKVIRSVNDNMDGISISTIREIAFMQYCHHPCSVKLLDNPYLGLDSSNSMEQLFSPMAIVMDYIENDLMGIEQSCRAGFVPWLSIDAIRWIMFQLFSVLDYLHKHNIIHRDIKSANLLLTKDCDLKLGDFGLSRKIGNYMINEYTYRVVTLWYRSPELILGCRTYGPEVDIWSAGCILGELLTGITLFHNYKNDDREQLDVIFRRCGCPTDPKLLSLMKERNVAVPVQYQREMRKYVYSACRNTKANANYILPDDAVDLLDWIMQTTPSARPTASKILCHPFFRDHEEMQFAFPVTEEGGSHEFEVRSRIRQIQTVKIKEVMLTRRKSEIDQWVSSRDVVDLTYDTEEQPTAVSKPVVSTTEGVSSMTVSSAVSSIEVSSKTVSSEMEVSSPPAISTSDLRPLIKQMTTELRESQEQSPREPKRKKVITRNRKVKPRAIPKRKKESSVGKRYRNDEFVGSEMDVQSDDLGEESNSEDLNLKRKNENENETLPEKSPTDRVDEMGIESQEGAMEMAQPLSPLSPLSRVSQSHRVKPSEVSSAEEVTSPSRYSKEPNRGVTVMNVNKNGQTMEVVVASGRKRAQKEIEYLYSKQSQELEEKEKRRLLRDEHMRRIEEKRLKAMLADAEKVKKKKEKKEKKREVKVKKGKKKIGRKLAEKKKSVKTQESEVTSPVKPLIHLNDQSESHSFVLASPQGVAPNIHNRSIEDSSQSSGIMYPSGLVLSSVPDDGFNESFVQITKEIPALTIEQPLFSLSQPERNESFQDIYTVNPATVRTLSPDPSPAP